MTAPLVLTDCYRCQHLQRWPLILNYCFALPPSKRLTLPLVLTAAILDFTGLLLLAKAGYWY